MAAAGGISKRMSSLFSFQNGPSSPNQQLNLQPTAGYGATEQHVTGNPFAAASNPFANATIAEEPVQPNATDTYMHGTTEDREY
jgi:hypothetical protein